MSKFRVIYHRARMTNTIKLEGFSSRHHRKSNYNLIESRLEPYRIDVKIRHKRVILAQSLMNMVVFIIIAIILLLSNNAKTSMSDIHSSKGHEANSRLKISHKSLNNPGDPILSDYLDGDLMTENSNQAHHNNENENENDNHNLHHSSPTHSEPALESSDYGYSEQLSKSINNQPDQHQEDDNSHQNNHHQQDQVSGEGIAADMDPTISIDDTLTDVDVGLQPEKEFLTSSLAERTCQLDRGCQRKDRLNNTYLSYCARHKLELLFSTDVIDDIMHGSSETCERVLDEFIRLDEQINKFHESFKTLLQRYNCHNGYSVKWTCNDCRRAYKDWLCTTNLPYYMNGERVKPCLSFCERVEQRCPYLHPITKEQYGGQPAFICKDPNIPFVPEITPNTLHSRPGKCYDLCHLSNDKRELSVDSLSTYDGYCPSKSMIAEQVRDEDVYCQTNSNNDTATSTSSYSSSNRDTTSNIGNKLLPCDHQQLQQQSAGFLNHEHAIIDESGHGQAAPTQHLGDNQRNNTNVINNYPLHCEKLNELSIIFESYKSQPKGHSFSHHDH